MHTNIQAKINRHWKDWFTYMQFVKVGAIQAKSYTYTFYSYTFGKHGVCHKLSDHLNGNTDSIGFSAEHTYSTFNSTKIINNCLEIRCGDQWLRMIHVESHAKYSRNTGFYFVQNSLAPEPCWHPPWGISQRSASFGLCLSWELPETAH